jgi:predicted nuclease of predicted toxin-antitoxin system
LNRIRLYLDEDMGQRRLLLALRAREVDVLTTVEAGQAEASDAEQLGIARQLGRVIYTANQRDFAKLHRDWINAGTQQAGIVVCTRQQLSPEFQAEQLARLVLSRTRADMMGALLYLTPATRW